MSKDFKAVMIITLSEVEENKVIIKGNIGNFSREIDINGISRT